MEVYLTSLVHEYPTAHLSLMAMNYLIKFLSVSHCLGSGQCLLLIILHISICEFSYKLTELILNHRKQIEDLVLKQLSNFE